MTIQTPTSEQIRTAWDALAAGFDQYVTPKNIPFGDEILRRVDFGPGSRFLDVACGTGALAVPAARRGADVTAVDLSPAMIEQLTTRVRAGGLTNVVSRVMDGNALEFDDDTFDVTASLNGISLFPDLSGGLREAVRVTRPGGRVVIAAFGAPQKAEFLVYFMGAMQAAVPGFTPLPMDPPPLPFQVADPEVLLGRLSDAGLSKVGVDVLTWTFRVESGTELWNLIRSSNPIGAQLAAGLTAEQQAEVRRVLDDMIRERSGGTPGGVLHAALNIGIGTT
ncbi:MAG TPA: methyltransferase domain-containing protein [Jiangellaceae bacterium]|nr:methyltransferase domain-containing protein [Jiangellaceae bacterium]